LDRVEVLRGLAAGEQVLLDPTVAEGRRVRARDSRAAREAQP
jgi:hypothetical protein